MSIQKTIGTILISFFIGAVTFFIATPKKISKKKEKSVSEPVDDPIDPKENLFI